MVEEHESVEEVDKAIQEVSALYSKVIELHTDYLAAKHPEGELEEYPIDIEWMAKLRKSRGKILSKYKEWKN